MFINSPTLRILKLTTYISYINVEKKTLKINYLNISIIEKKCLSYLNHRFDIIWLIKIFIIGRRYLFIYLLFNKIVAKDTIYKLIYEAIFIGKKNNKKNIYILNLFPLSPLNINLYSIYIWTQHTITTSHNIFLY